MEWLAHQPPLAMTQDLFHAQDVTARIWMYSNTLVLVSHLQGTLNRGAVCICLCEQLKVWGQLGHLTGMSHAYAFT